eukprot:scaffold7759_cov62-Cylindrotheca_fusiformis.AAC.6
MDTLERPSNNAQLANETHLELRRSSRNWNIYRAEQNGFELAFCQSQKESPWVLVEWKDVLPFSPIFAWAFYVLHNIYHRLGYSLYFSTADRDFSLTIRLEWLQLLAHIRAVGDQAGPTKSSMFIPYS